VRAEEDFRWGVRAYHNGYFGDSILSLEKSLGVKPERVLTRLWLGNALFRAGFVDAALREWSFVLDREPGNAELKARVQILGYRRGLGRELEPPSPFVVAHEIDGAKEDIYPLARPTAIHFRPDGSFYVTAFAGGEIVHMNVNSRVLKVLSAGFKGYNRPFDCLEVMDPGTGTVSLFISEYGANRIVRAGLNGQELGRFGAPGSGPGMLLGPQYLATDGRGYLYVSEWGNRRISKFDLSGNFILTIGDGRTLENPSGLVVLGNRVYVADHSRGRIVVFDDSGNHLYSFGENRLRRPEGIVVWDSDTLLISDENRILQYRITDETWNTLSDLSAAAGRLTHLALSPNGELYATDFDRNRIFVLSQMSDLYSNLAVGIERIDSTRFPEITVEISAETRGGNPLVGLEGRNFIMTEGYQPVGAPRLIRANTDPATLESILLVEKSIVMKGFERDLVEAAERLFQELGQRGGLQVLSADRRPRVDAPFGSSRLEVSEAVRRPDWTPGWRFDLGIRMAASELIPRGQRKAVVYVGSGSLPDDSFGDYTLVEVADYLKNNGIPLYVVYFGRELAPELEFLCAETGGGAFSYYAPAGLNPVLALMRRWVSSRYMLRYTSRSEGRFGMNYIELRTEVVLHRKSGRAASGYYAPLSD
jgi:DNA-binding beta-propeller fold protein YncE